MDWPIADPVGQPFEEVARIRDDLTARLNACVMSFGASPSHEDAESDLERVRGVLGSK